MRINKNTILYNVFLLTLSNTGLQILGFVYRIFISRMITPESMGVYQLIFPFYSVIMAISLSGICISVSRLTAEKYAVDDKEGVRSIVRICLTIFMLLFAIVTVCTMLFSEFIAGTILGDSRTETALLILLPNLFLTGIENIFKSCFYGIKKLYPPIFSELFEQVIRIIAVAILLSTLRPESPTLAVICIVTGMVISEVMSATVLTFFYKKYLPKEKSRSARYVDAREGYMTESPRVLKDIIVITLPVTMAGLIHNILSSINTVLVPKRLVISGMLRQKATETFGILFGMTMPLLMLPSVFIGALSTIMIPRLSENMALGYLSRARERIAKTVYVTGLITFPVFAVIIAVGQPLCDLFYRQSKANDYLAVLAISSVFVYYDTITASILNAIGQQKKVFINTIIGGVIEILFTYYMVAMPAFGMYGFVAGYCVSHLLMSALNMRCIVRRVKLKIKYFDWFVLPALNGILLGLLTSLFYVALSSHGVNEVASLIIPVVSAATVYVGMLKLQGINVVGYILSKAQ